MRGALARGPFGVTARHCVRTNVLPTLAALAAALALHLATAPEVGGDGAAAAASPWLVLPLLVAAGGCTLRAAAMWPLFALGRDGRESVQRLTPGALGGRGAVIAGALAAQLALAAPLTPLLARLLGAPPAAARHLELVPDGAGLLDGATPQLYCDAPPGTVATAIALRPVATLPTGALQSTRIALDADGRALGAGPIAFAETRELAVLRFPALPVTRLGLTRVDGNVPLWFPVGSIVVVEPASAPTWLNALVAALLTLLPSFVALAVAALLGLGARWPTVATAIGAALFVQWVGELGPMADASLALLRGQWLATAAVFRASVPTLALGFLACGATALLGRVRPGMYRLRPR